MKRLATLALSTALLAGCGAVSAPSTVNSDDLAGKSADQAPATIVGQVSIDLWHCGGAAPPPNDPPHGPCHTTAPFATTFAVAKVLDDTGSKLELQAYVTSDAAGHYSVSVPAGRYTLVSKYAITHDPNDQSGIYGPGVAPFTVAAGETVTKDFTFMTPPPPITIGVGN